MEIETWEMPLTNVIIIQIFDFIILPSFFSMDRFL